MEKSKSTMGVVAAVIVIILAGLALVFSMSGDDDKDMMDTDTNMSSAAASDNTAFALDLDVSELDTLEEGAYEGWVVRGDDKYTFGVFNTNEQGEIVGDLAFEDSDFAPRNGDMVVITIEPVPDADPEPSGVIILSGEIQNDSADLEFPVDTSGFAGEYILATPTNDPDGFEGAGVWFLNPSTSAASLDIPDAPDGWVYEGWIVYEGTTPITTGKFKSATGADFFDGYSGPNPGPAFPGEDLIQDLPNGLEGPLEFNDGMSMIVISIEPDIDGEDPTGDGPAQVKPLSSVVADGAADHSLFPLTNNPETPSGSARLR